MAVSVGVVRRWRVGWMDGRPCAERAGCHGVCIGRVVAGGVVDMCGGHGSSVRVAPMSMTVVALAVVKSQWCGRDGVCMVPRVLWRRAGGSPCGQPCL